MNRKKKEVDQYSQRHLIYHLKEAGKWDKILLLIDDPTFGEQAKEALKEKEGKIK